MSDGRPPAPLPLIRNLDARFVAAPSGALLSKIAWSGPRLDPAALSARSMLAWLR